MCIHMNNIIFDIGMTLKCNATPDIIFDFT